MTQRLLLLASHGVAEYDDLRMFARLGYDVFAPGGYEDPTAPGETLRPAIPDAPRHPELAALCRVQRERHRDEPADYAIDWAKADLHPTLREWADVIIVHHFPDRWVPPLLRKGKRVIWRTCGQSDPDLETRMTLLRRLGLEIVRYSPAERRAFELLRCFAGEDALIRFGKDPAEWHGWTGEDAVVGNVSQWSSDGNPLGRAAALNLGFWGAVTDGLPTRPAGPGSEALPGGIGALGYDDMRAYLRRVRAYLYTGTQPASYTLGLIEAMMTGVPVVSIGPAHMWMPELFEGHTLTGLGYDDPAAARRALDDLLDVDIASKFGLRERAISLFGIDHIGAQWADYLGRPSRAEFAHERTAVTA